MNRAHSNNPGELAADRYVEWMLAQHQVSTDISNHVVIVGRVPTELDGPCIAEKRGRTM